MINSMGKPGRHMKLSFMRVAAYALTFALGGMFCVVVSGEPPHQDGARTCLHACTDKEGDRVRAMQGELAGTRGTETPSIRDSKPITFKVTTDSASTLMFAKPCTGGTTNDVAFTVNDGNGKPIVSINECTGKVTVAHPERMNEQARAFWQTLQKTWPQVCAPPKAPKK